MTEQFDQAKAALHPQVREWCRELLLKTEAEKSSNLCVFCEDANSCNRVDRLIRALRWLLEALAMEALEESFHRRGEETQELASRVVCLLAPALSTEGILLDLLKGKSGRRALQVKNRLRAFRAATDDLRDALVRLKFSQRTGEAKDA